MMKALQIMEPIQIINNISFKDASLSDKWGFLLPFILSYKQAFTNAYTILALKKFGRFQRTHQYQSIVPVMLQGLCNNVIKIGLYPKLLQRNVPTLFQNRYSTKQIWVTASEGSVFFSSTFFALSLSS